MIGYDYAFGRNREGDSDFLLRQGEAFGFAVEIVGPIVRDGEVYSSTRIREMIRNGQVAEAAKLLGRHFTLEGGVVHGAKRGKGLGFPTANLETDKELLPRPGVYAVKVRYGEEILDGVVNIGCNPTFCCEGISVEVHLLDFDREIYGEMLRLYFVARLRDEMLFPAPAELVQAIGRDVARARELLAGARLIEYREYLDCGQLVGPRPTRKALKRAECVQHVPVAHPKQGNRSDARRNGKCKRRLSSSRLTDLLCALILAFVYANRFWALAESAGCSGEAAANPV